MKIICGVKHSKDGTAINDDSYMKLKKNVLSKIVQGKSLLISEGGNKGLLQLKDNNYKELIQRIHPYLFSFCQKNKPDLLLSDPRSPQDFEGNMKRYLSFTDKIQRLANSIEITEYPKSFSGLERVILNNKISFTFRDTISEELRLFGKETAEEYSFTDTIFVKQMEDFEGKYDNVLLIVGGAHYFNIKCNIPTKDTLFINCFDENSIQMLTKAFACYYLCK